MSEGTKLGEFKDSSDFSTAVKKDTESSPEPQNLQGTSYGSLTEQDRQFYENAIAEASQEETSESSDSGSDASQSEGSNDEFLNAMGSDSDSSSESQDSSMEADSEFEKEMMRLDVDLRRGDIIKGIVRSIEKSGVLVDIGYKADGYILNSEFSADGTVSAEDTLSPGDEVSVYIESLESKEGYAVLSRKRAEFEISWNSIGDVARHKEVVSVRIASQVQGGLVADYNGIRGFIPASQLLSDDDADLNELVGKALDVVVLRADRKRRKVIFSQKSVTSRRSKEAADELFDSLEIGQVREGQVTSVKDFGAFIDLGGVEGLVHISEMSWSRISHPNDVVSMGADVKVFVLGIDKDNRRVSLGMKQLETDPWVEVVKGFDVGQVVDGKVTRIVPFGAFVSIHPKLEGLIHISEISDDHVKQVEDYLKAGDTVKVKIIKLIPEEQKIGLSLRAATDPEPEPEPEPEIPSDVLASVETGATTVDVDIAGAMAQGAAAAAEKAAAEAAQAEESASSEEASGESDDSQ